MSYKFMPGEGVRGAIRRCAGEQLDRAIDELTDGVRSHPVEAIHDARKAIKKERSLLRLARATMAPAERRRDNEALRAAARKLSGARDADVLISTLDDLAERFSGQLPAATFDGIRRQLVHSRDAGGSADSAELARAVVILREVRTHAGDWPLRRDGWKAIKPGLARSYRRGRKLLAKAQRERSAETWHSWRKRVKDLWHQERLLSELCGPAIRGQASDAHRLSDLLGDDHDLALLREALASGDIEAPVDSDAVIGLIDHRREELQARAIHVGQRVYAESPKAFSRRLKRYWEAGQAQVDEPIGERPIELARATTASTPSCDGA
jgi:CHAD domain-containing protein